MEHAVTPTRMVFPLLNGGEESGLSESGIESFHRPEALGRETCQNILDNRDQSGRPGIAEFEYLDLPVEAFPDVKAFKLVFEACSNHVLSVLKQGTGNERVFFENGSKLLSGRTIPTLRIRDENTTGLVGTDEDRASPFWRLLKGQGFSVLQGVGGGTYGIGQRAPFAHSDLRTVLYSTRLPSDEEAFVAKAILASHPSPFFGSRMAQSKGWFCYRHGDDSGNQTWSAIRGKDVPALFRRSAVGTDLYIAGFQMTDWERRIRDSVLVNFFSAIDRGLLEVRIKRRGEVLTEVTRANLETKLLEAAAEAQRELTREEYKRGLGATLYYLKALRYPYNGAPAEKVVPNVGVVRLYVYRDQNDSAVPERWAAMRRPMMVVETHGSSLLRRFAAVLVCEDQRGNEFLSRMEDPTHSRWHEDEARNWTTEQKKQGREARLAIGRFVTETLRALRDPGAAQQDVPLLGRYLPLEDDPTAENSIGDGIEPTGTITTNESGHLANVSSSGVQRGRARPAAPLPRAATTEGKEGKESGGEFVAGGPGEEPGGGGAGTGLGGGGQGNGHGPGVGPGTGGSGGTRGETRVPGTGSGFDHGPQGAKSLTPREVRFRSYGRGGRYRVILEAIKADVRGDIELRAVGEDSNYPLRLLGARDADAGTVHPVAGARIQAVELVMGQVRKIDVELEGGLTTCLTIGG